MGGVVVDDDNGGGGGGGDGGGGGSGWGEEKQTLEEFHIAVCQIVYFPQQNENMIIGNSNSLNLKI